MNAMAEQRPVFAQVNVVVRDMDATLAFYRRLGLEIPDDFGEWPAGSGARHVENADRRSVKLEFDNVPSARSWHASWREGGHGSKVVIGISLPTRESVDERYADMTGAGYTGCQPPYDAYWGARYAVIGDPDGNDVGLMSPIDQDRKYEPTP